MSDPLMIPISLFDDPLEATPPAPPPPPAAPTSSPPAKHGKRPTRWKAEVIDRDGHVLWEILVNYLPDPTLRADLHRLGYRIRRANVPKIGGPLPMVYSELDPAASVAAAREHADRRETQLGNALLLLLDADGGWVPRAAIRRVAGDSGDRRVRELRERNWPVEIRQLVDGDPWSVRLILPRFTR